MKQLIPTTNRFVLKFGGKALISSKGITNAVMIVKHFLTQNPTAKVAVAVSANGFAKTIIERILKAQDVQADVKSLTHYYFTLIEKMPLQLKESSVYGRLRTNIIQKVMYIKDVHAMHHSRSCEDYAIGSGELISTQLFMAYYNALATDTDPKLLYIPSRELLFVKQSSEEKQERTLIVKPANEYTTNHALSKWTIDDSSKLMLTESSYASDPYDQPVTLGSEGGDYGAVGLGATLNAQKVILYKDVLGIYSKDPKANQNVTKYNTLSAEELQKFQSHTPLQIIHPRCVDIISKYSIPVSIRSFKKQHRDCEGTIIIPAPALVY